MLRPLWHHEGLSPWMPSEERLLREVHRRVLSNETFIRSSSRAASFPPSGSLSSPLCWVDDIIAAERRATHATSMFASSSVCQWWWCGGGTRESSRSPLRLHMLGAKIPLPASLQRLQPDVWVNHINCHPRLGPFRPPSPVGSCDWLMERLKAADCGSRAFHFHSVDKCVFPGCSTCGVARCHFFLRFLLSTPMTAKSNLQTLREMCER